MRAPQIRFLGVEEEAASSAVLFNPQSELLVSPDLLIRGQKPVGPVMVDQTHPIAKGLRYFDLLNDSDSARIYPERAVYNVGIRRNGTGDTATFSRELTRYGPGVSAAGDAATQVDVTPSISTAYSLFCVFTAGTAASTRDLGVGSDWNGTGRLNQFRLSATHYPELIVWDDVDTITSDVTVNTDGTLNVVVATADDVGNLLTITVNGTYKSQAYTDVLTALDYLNLGTNRSSSHDGTFLAWGLWGRALTKSESIELCSDPYQLLIPA